MKPLRLITVFFAAGLIFSFVNEKEKRNFSDKNYFGSFETENGRITGKYISYYKNGKKKAEGNFICGLRTGEWKVWDSTGVLCVKRNYKNGFEFEQTLPKRKNEGPIPLLAKNKWILHRDKDSVYSYSYLQEKNVIAEKRVSRFLPAENNEVLFEKNYFFTFLLKEINNKNFVPYKPVPYESQNRNFWDTLSVEKLQTESLNIIGYEILEDWFFDFETMKSETRIIGISPLTIRVNIKKEKAVAENDTVPLFDLYYPACRKYFAKETLNQKNLPASVKNLDDYFYFRAFCGIPFNAADYRYTKDPILTQPSKKSDSLEVSMIEWEHDLWLHFAGK